MVCARILPGILLLAISCLPSEGAPAAPVAPVAIRPPRSTLNLETTIQRPLRYRPDGTDFVIDNGPEFFNRPLYTNTAFRVDGGDKPEFSLFLPGRGGNLRLGVRTSAGAFWLSEAAGIVTRYRPGSLLYEVTDPRLGGAVLRVTAMVLTQYPGFIVRAELSGGPDAKLIFAYGGANGDRGSRDGDIGTERLPVGRFFQLRPEFCTGDVFTIGADGFTLVSPAGEVQGVASAGTRFAAADAALWDSPAALLASGGTPAPGQVIAGEAELAPGGAPFLLALRRVQRPGEAVKVLKIYQEVEAGERTEQFGAAAAKPPDPSASNLAQLFDSAEAHRREIAGAISVDTPDPFVNAAAAALCVEADGVWDEPSGTVQHGGAAWRVQLLGWRGPYANDEMGWHDRALRHFSFWAARQNSQPVPAGIAPPDAAANLARNEAALHSNGDISDSHYDMNLVYIDEVFRNLEWTGDMAFARRMWPVIERHLAWERRLFRRTFGPDSLPLYEAYCCIWASDDVAYEGGGATHSSAYNYYENRMAARLARLIGEDPAPYDREAGLIWKAMHQELWLADRGWFGEWKDLLGRQEVHPSAALWTFYHTVDSGAATPMEAWQMTRFIDTQIAHIPIVGPGEPTDGSFVVPTTDWMPYTWSTNNVVMAEVEHTALGYWQAGRPAEAYRMFKGAILTSMYLGLCPGNAGMTNTFDMARGESQRDFADGVAMTARALVEGLFGIVPDALGGELHVHPGFPKEWDHAHLRHADLTFDFQRSAAADTYVIEPRFPRPMALRLELPALRDRVASATVNGQPAEWRVLEDAVGAPRIEVDAPAAPLFKVEIAWQGEAPAAARAAPVAALGREFRAELSPSRIVEVADPQGSLLGLASVGHAFKATAAGSPGFRTVFARVEQGQMRWWEPVSFEIRPGLEIAPGADQDAGGLRFRIRNNTDEPLATDAVVSAGGRSMTVHVAIPSEGTSDEITVPADGLLPGANRVAADLGPLGAASCDITDWRLAVPQGTQLDPVDLGPVLNDRVTQIFRNDYLDPRSPFCSLSMPKQGIGTWCRFNATANVDDTGLRAAAGGGGHLVLPDGLAFATPGPGSARNIAFTSQWKNYPVEQTVALHGSAGHVYLLMAGSTNSMQSRFDNGEVLVSYRDGTTARLALENPTNWWPIDEDYWLDDFAFKRPGPIPPRVDLQTGTVRLLDPAAFAGKGRRVGGGAATVLDLPLDPGKELQSLTVRTLANEVVIGLMAATLAR
ncbi:MAG TPA: DUF4450 domain-containing protein [Opitutaceae bacterium]|nr:DUF4450 domain-containing protein [Opitutaceae bacterium]